MHGTMFLHLRTFVEAHHGDAAYRGILDRAGLGPRVYLPIRSYPDEELAAIVTTAAEVLNAPVPQLLEDFGKHVAPHLMAMYRHLLRPEWRTLDVLLHVEETAHRAVRIATSRNGSPSPSPPACIAVPGTAGSWSKQFRNPAVPLSRPYNPARFQPEV